MHKFTFIACLALFTVTPVEQIHICWDLLCNAMLNAVSKELIQL